MIQLPRSLVRHVRTVFRRLAKGAPRQPAVVFHAANDGLRIRLHHADIQAEHHSNEIRGRDECLALSLQALADFEGRGDQPVNLEAAAKQVVARWHDRDLPQVKAYPAVELKDLPKYPAVPGEMAEQEAGLWKALADASRSAAPDAIRYALKNLQLRGDTGDIVATDGKQLLVQSGFRFPWTDRLLIPASTVFGCKEIATNEGVRLGRSKNHVTLQAGDWTLHFPVEDGRFPNVDTVLPARISAKTSWKLDPVDAGFLARVLARLPAKDEDHLLAVDLGEQVCVRVRADDSGPVTEVVLARSTFTGRQVRFQIDRNLLGRILELGFYEVHIVDAQTPMVCEDSRRRLGCMPLGKPADVPAGVEVLRIASTDEAVPTPAYSTERKPTLTKHSQVPEKPTLTAALSSQPAGVHRTGNLTSEGSLIEEAEALRVALRDAYVRAGQLVQLTRRQKKQTRFFREAIASLKQLEDAG